MDHGEDEIVTRLRVSLQPADRGGCGTYRMILPGEALIGDPDLDVVIGESLNVVGLRKDGAEENPLHDPIMCVEVDADVVVFQRPLKSVWTRVIARLQAQGVACVVDIDDDFHALPKGHPGRKAWAPMNDAERNWRWLAQACSLADLVTCTTPALAERYAPHGRFMVLPNCVPAWYLDVEPDRGPDVSIIWPGWAVTHTGDLDVVGDAVARVQAETGCGFIALGGSETLRLLGVEGVHVPWTDLADRGPDGYVQQVARAHVGIAPLADSRFNAAKSFLKPIEFAALGVAFVASPRADYRNLRDTHGIGLLADSSEDWHQLLAQLVTDDAWRGDVAAENRERMRALTYEGNAWRWAEAWMLAYANRAKARAA